MYILLYIMCNIYKLDLVIYTCISHNATETTWLRFQVVESVISAVAMPLVRRSARLKRGRTESEPADAAAAPELFQLSVMEAERNMWRSRAETVMVNAADAAARDHLRQERMQCELNELYAQAEASSAERNCLRQELDALQTRLAQLEGSQTYEARIAALVQAQVQLQEEMQLREMKSRGCIEQLTREADTRNTHTRELEAKADEWKLKYEEKVAAEKLANKWMSDLSAEMETTRQTLGSSIRAMSEELAATKTALTTVRQERDNLSSVVLPGLDRLEAELPQLRARNRELESQLVAAQTRASSLEGQLALQQMKTGMCSGNTSVS